MTPRLLLTRSLRYHRGIHLAVALGVAVGAAVLAGALLVGDSVRGSLRDLTLDRLGNIEQALVADRFFRQELADEIDAVPAVMIRGTAENADSGARASKITVLGSDERFWELYDVAAPELGLRDVVINESLARELAVTEGEAMILRFQTDALIPSESVMGRKTDTTRTLRLTVQSILPDRGPGRFGLSPNQLLPFNAFLSLGSLQRAMEQRGRANVLFSAVGSGSGDVNERLRAALQLDDVELTAAADEGSITVETSRIVLEPTAAEAASVAADELGLASVSVLTYLANSIESGDRAVPYSTVSALSGTPELTLVDGSLAAPLTGDGVYLNDWAARDLGASVGDAVEMSYYAVGAGGALITERHTFTLQGIVQLAGLAADRNLAPVYEGMSDSDRMGDWDPPFPVNLDLIRPVDEEYWEQYRTAPKAFVAFDTAKELWTSRFGTLTSVRVSPPNAEYAELLRQRLDPASQGLAFMPVREQGLAASAGATDFSGLFIGFSLFLIAAAAMLVTLLFRLGVERRAKEIGLLLATGESVKFVRNLLLKEGAIVAAIGCLIGLPAAVGYGWLMVYGLSTWWSAAVGGSFLELHVSPISLIAGLVGAFLLMIFSVWLAVRKLGKLSVRSLLSGVVDDSGLVPAEERARRPRLIGIVCAALAVALALGSVLSDALAPAAAFFGVGALALIAVLSLFRASLLKPSRNTVDLTARVPLLKLGVKNAARFPTRSMLSAALIASATFVIVTVGVNRHDASLAEPSFESGDGGFRLIAESDAPLHRTQLNEANLLDARLYALRTEAGEDASCLNLYRPTEPTLLGAPQDMIDRGGFAFQTSLAETPEEWENPWLVLDRDLLGGVIPVFGDANSVMWILHLGVGDTLEVKDSQGRPRQLVIAGLLSRSIFQSQLIMSEDNFLELRPDHSGFNTFLVDTENATVSASLEDQWSEFGFDATTTGDRLAGYLVVENTYLSTFETLGGLGLLLGVLGLAVVMVRNVLERESELALLQAMGFGRRAVVHLVLAENGWLLIFGVMAGALAAVLAVFPRLIAGLAHPPWGSLALTLTVIVLTGLISGAVAVRKSLSSDLLPSLRKE